MAKGAALGTGILALLEKLDPMVYVGLIDAYNEGKWRRD